MDTKPSARIGKGVPLHNKVRLTLPYQEGGKGHTVQRGHNPHKSIKAAMLQICSVVTSFRILFPVHRNIVKHNIAQFLFRRDIIHQNSKQRFVVFVVGGGVPKSPSHLSLILCCSQALKLGAIRSP